MCRPTASSQPITIFWCGLSRCCSLCLGRLPPGLAGHAKVWHFLHQSHQQTLRSRGRVIPGAIPPVPAVQVQAWQAGPELRAFAQPVRVHPCQPGQGWVGGPARRLGIFQLSRLDRPASRHSGQPGIRPGALWRARRIPKPCDGLSPHAAPARGRWHVFAGSGMLRKPDFGSLKRSHAPNSRDLGVL